jgi:NTE family protein
LISTFRRRHKSLAHAGVLQFLAEINIRPQAISGTSAGGVVGALYAWGKHPNFSFFKSIYFFIGGTLLLKAGLIDSESFKYFTDVFKDAVVSDLKIPMKITATDMVKGRLKIFDSDTKIVDALLASSAFPGIISP